jgi:hypothetical protein
VQHPVLVNYFYFGEILLEYLRDAYCNGNTIGADGLNSESLYDGYYWGHGEVI